MTIRIKITIPEANKDYCRLSIWVNGGLVSDPESIFVPLSYLKEFLLRLKPNKVVIKTWDDAYHLLPHIDIGASIIWPKKQPSKAEARMIESHQLSLY